tara:strand:+ start:24 stop:380 length:357 start_codon:yes stop_codon:yes gene_type:complete
MTTENTGSPHDPDYNISVSSAPDNIRAEYAPPVGSAAERTYNPNRHYPDYVYERAMDGGVPDPDFMWPDDGPDKTQEMLHRISDGFNKILIHQRDNSEKLDKLYKLLSDHINDTKPTA